ncbi:MAG: hypothetical protein RDA78_16110 [Roseibium sp.]|uniref:hypothetical protein n=1 Tax=Roseibium sp. TaxID=1936156 RepID=UPI003D9C3328
MKIAIDWFVAMPLTKVAVIAIFAVIGAALPKDLSPRDRLMTFFVGFMAAMVFGEPLREVLSMSDSWAFGMAGILAMTGRNLAVFILRVSRDPVGSGKVLLELWRRKPGE